MSDAPTSAAPAAESATAAPTSAAPAPASASAPAETPSATTDGTAQPAVEPAATAPSPTEEKPADAPTSAAPETYADFTAPEGVAMDAEVGNNLKAFAKEKGLSQEDAQKLADMGFAAVQKTQAAFQDQLTKMQAQWVADTRADKEFGGDKLAENLAVAKRALDTYGSEALVKLLNESGLGNHPEIIRYNFRVAQALNEDKLIPGGKAPVAPTAQNFYSKSGMNP